MSAKNNKYNKLLSDSFIFAIGNFITKLLTFFLMPLYTTYLTTEQYGIADILNTTIELLLPIFTISITDAIFRFCLDKDSDKSIVLSSSIKIIFIGSIILILLCPILTIFFDIKIIILGLLLYITTALKNAFCQFTRGIGEVKKFAVSGIVTAATMITMNIILLTKFALGIEGYILAICIANLVACIYILLRTNIKEYIKIKYMKVNLANRLIKYSIYLIPNSIAWWFTNIFSRYILMGIDGASASGIYAASSKIPTVINILSNIFQQAWQASSTEEYNSSDRDDFYTKIFRVFSVFLVIAASIIILLIPYISRFILKNEFYTGWKITPILVLAAIFSAYSSYFGTFYIVTKKSKMILISTIIGAVINVIGCIVLIPLIGIIGAAIASTLGYLAITIIRIIDTKRYVHIQQNWVKQGTNIIILVGQCIVWLIYNSNIGIILNSVLFLILILTNIKESKELIVKIINTIIEKNKCKEG